MTFSPRQALRYKRKRLVRPRSALVSCTDTSNQCRLQHSSKCACQGEGSEHRQEIEVRSTGADPGAMEPRLQMIGAASLVRTLRMQALMSIGQIEVCGHIVLPDPYQSGSMVKGTCHVRTGSCRTWV